MAAPSLPSPNPNTSEVNNSVASQRSQRQLPRATHVNSISGHRGIPGRFNFLLDQSIDQLSMCKAAITIPSLVCLRRAVRRWRSRAAAEEASSSSSGEGSGAAAVPAGHVAVRVQAGGCPRRFVVRVAHLGHPAFRELLRQAEEEYGFPAADGPISLPCDEDHFLDVLHRVSSSATRSSCCCLPAAMRRRRCGESRPLLQGMAVEKLTVC